MSVELTSAQRRALRARAHALNPVVSVAQHGLSPSVMKEIEASLKAHELIKIRVYGEDRDVREALLTQICEAVSAAPVQHIGNILVIYRQNPEAEPAPAKPARKPSASAGKGAKVTAKTPARGGVRAAGPRKTGAAVASPRRRAVAAPGKGRGSR